MGSCRMEVRARSKCPGTCQWKEELGCVTGVLEEKLRAIQKRQEKTLDKVSRVQVVVRLNEFRAWRSL